MSPNAAIMTQPRFSLRLLDVTCATPSPRIAASSATAIPSVDNAPSLKLAVEIGLATTVAVVDRHLANVALYRKPRPPCNLT